MTDNEISQALALAVGYQPQNVQVGDYDVQTKKQIDAMWRIFDYRDWNVIGPIAEKYNAFPIMSSNGTWSAPSPDGEWVDGMDTPQKATAMAIIGDAE